MPDIYRDLNYTADQVDEAVQTIGIHVANNAIHVNQSEKDSWNAKADSSALSAETSAREAADSDLSTRLADKATVSDIYGLPPTTIAPAEGTTDTLASHILPGAYVIPTATAAGRITDAPISDKGYRMEVKQYRSGAYYRQTIMPWGEPNAFYTRSRQGGTNWTAWYKFEGTQVAASAQSSAASLMQSGRLDAEQTDINGSDM